MPTLDEALRFARDPRTTAEQLRQACLILELDGRGEADALRDRLLARLRELRAEEEVVCLNPRVADAGRAPR